MGASSPPPGCLAGASSPDGGIFLTGNGQTTGNTWLKMVPSHVPAGEESKISLHISPLCTAVQLPRCHYQYPESGNSESFILLRKD